MLSLLQTSDPKNDTIDPAIKGTTNILKATLEFSKVKRVVITSSVASVVPLNQEDLIAASDHTFTG
jgi:nucleoside-diphosphate-sugar epimerase